MLKTGVRNYFGGRLDLKQLVEQYPDSEVAANAYQQLADASAMVGLEEEAVRLYRKVYDLGSSLESQAAGALGAGRCSYRAGDFKSAAKWLTRHITLAGERKSKDLYSACFILGKTYIALEQFSDACTALEGAVEGGPAWLPREQYVEAVSTLVDAYMHEGQFVKALDMLEGVQTAALSRKGVVGILLLKSKIFRSIGLVDKAITLLGDRAGYVRDSQLVAGINFELSECYIEKGNLNLARKKLVEILVLAEPGPLAHQSALNLADICLKLGHDSQAISVCSQLLEMEPPERIKQEALRLLATAYNQRKNYDSAALALLGQWK
jgi:tetratricopeptide (TPR) repeat protein